MGKCMPMHCFVLSVLRRFKVRGRGLVVMVVVWVVVVVVVVVVCLVPLGFLRIPTITWAEN